MEKETDYYYQHNVRARISQSGMSVVGFGCTSCSETHGQSLWSGEDFQQGSGKFFGGVSPAN